jgi:phage tail sheath protein FI
VDTPVRLAPDAQGLIDWVTGVNAGSNGEDGLVTKSSEAAVYYPSVLTTNLDGTDVVAPASHVVLRTYAYNDNVSYPWFAPAGLTRGVVTNATNFGYVTAEGEFQPLALNAGQRDTLYANKVNPLVNFPGQGLVVWGQKTLSPIASALDRVNVARLIAYLREQFDPLARPFIFEPNDLNTRSNVKALFDRFLGDIMQKRGVYDFVVVCDETNNTPARIDANELWIDVAIEPVKAAEFIYIPIRIVNTGALS